MRRPSHGAASSRRSRPQHRARTTTVRPQNGRAFTGGEQQGAVRPPRLVRSEHRRQNGTTSGQVFWLSDHPDTASSHGLRQRMTVLTVTACSISPRLQRRDRDGFKPSSLFSRSNTPQAPKSPGMVSPARGIATNAVRRAERPVEQRRVSLQLARFLAVKTGKRDAYPTFFNWLLGWFV